MSFLMTASSFLRARLFPLCVINIFVLAFFYPLFGNIGLPHWDSPAGSDAILQGVFIKTIIETGWLWFNPNMGAPFGTSLMDFPGSDGVFLLLIKIFALITDDAATILNILLLLSYYMVFFSSYWAFRRLSFDSIWATTAAFIFTCLPYHFLRGASHLYLANYFVIPFWVWLAVEVYERTDSTAIDKPAWSWDFVFLLLIVCGSAGVYYAFFGVFLVLISSVIATFEFRSFSGIKLALKIGVITVFIQFINIIPNLWYWWNNGLNGAVARRAAIESEIYGLRITQLLLPVMGHRSNVLDNFSKNYYDVLRPITEGSSAGLGLITGFGFIILTLVAILGCIPFGRDKRIVLLSRLNMSLVIFATVGGFGVLFAMLITPQFRGLTRISVYIAFISLLGLFLWIRSRWGGRFDNMYGRKYLGYAFVAFLLALAIYDQIPKGAWTPVISGAQEEASERGIFRAFIREVGARVTKRAMIYTEPYTPFPEAAPNYKEPYNGMMRPYFYSNDIRWSYGAMTGRLGDAWLQAVEKMPVPSRVRALQATGFEGIYVDRRAYADHGATFELELAPFASDLPLVSADNNYAFYPIKPDAVTQITPAFGLTLSKGFFAGEKTEFSRWAWSSGHGHIFAYNFHPTPVGMTLEVSLQGIESQVVSVYLKQSHNRTLLADQNLNAGEIVKIQVSFVGQPGQNIIEIESNKPPVKLPTDERQLSFRIIDPRLKN